MYLSIPLIGLCIKLSTGEGWLICGQIWLDILRELKPVIGMPQLVPVPVASAFLLVLLLKIVSVYMMEFLKRRADHRGYLHT